MSFIFCVSKFLFMINIKYLNRNYIPYIVIVIVYVTIRIFTLNNCFFWDNIQQVSNEAHWFYLNDFKSLFIPKLDATLGISATGYHPPLMGITTALLWKTFGYHLWTHHIFLVLWGIILTYNLHKVLSNFFQGKYISWILTIILFESALISQFVVSSPDFILFTAFVVSFRAIIEHKKYLLTVGLFFLCCINMRGVFAGLILYIVNHYYVHLLDNHQTIRLKTIIQTSLPYLPVFFILTAYFSYYLFLNGWFFTNSAYSSHYVIPDSLSRILKHLAEFGIRTLENGRFFVWILGVILVIKILQKKIELTNEIKVVLLCLVLLNGLYFLFVFISQMAFSARYFMPQYFLMIIFVLWGVIKLYPPKKIKLLFALILLFHITGNLWVYPDKIAKSWDTTLSHLSYYRLREKCFEYLDCHQYDYNEVSAGFCLYGNRKYIELIGENKKIGHDPNRKYFIYSNISNLEDDFVDDIKDPQKWHLIKTFKKNFIEISLYENMKVTNTH